MEKFYGFPGVKSTTAATLDGKDVGGSGETDLDNPLGLDDSNPVNSFSATFDDAVNNNDYLLTNWYNVAVTGGRRWQGKIFNNTDKYIQATSYNASGSNFECWFVTPAFKVDEIADKTVSFKCAVYNYATAAANSNLEVYFLKLVNGKMESSKLTIDGMPTTDNTWVLLEAKLDSYAGQTGFVGFKYTSTSSTEALSYRLDDIQAGKGQGGGETPGEGTELLTNGGFENWADGYPTGWKSTSTASSATLEQSTDKRSGTYSVLVKGVSSSNKRLGSAEMTLKAGTYMFSAYFKAATADIASARLGYVPVDETGKAGSYVYDADYVNGISNEDWVTKSFTFTLSGEQKICLVIMNSGNPGKDLLVDDASLKTEDGGIVGGVEEPDPEPSEADGTEAHPYSAADVITLNSTQKGPFYVKAYIIGAANGAMDKIQTSGFSGDTNIVIADKQGETEVSKLVPVQLPSGAIRTAWGLKTNPDKLGKQVVIQANLENYFSVPGLKSPTSITEVVK